MPENFNTPDQSFSTVKPIVFNIGRDIVSAQVKKAIFGTGEGIDGEDTTAFVTGDKTQIEADHISKFFGTPVLSNVRFFLPNNLDEINNKGFYPDETNSTILDVPTALIVVSQRRNIVVNIVKGRNNSVKEYINDGDFDIQINLAIISQDPNEYPTTEVSRLRQIMQLQTAIRIESDYLELFGVRSAVVKDYTAPQQRGLYATQNFNIKLISDDEQTDLDIIKC